MDPAFYAVMELTYPLSLLVKSRLNSIYATYSRLPNRAGFSGGQVARDILFAND